MSPARLLSAFALAAGLAAACGSFGGADNNRTPGPVSTSSTGPPAGADGSADAMGPVGQDGAPDAAGVPLRCGATLVCRTTPCCVEQVGSSSATSWTYQCIAPCPAKEETATLECTDGSSCPSGQVCCASVISERTTAKCQPSCASPATQLCDPRTAATTRECGAGKTCSTSNIAELFLDASYGECKSTE